MSLFRRGTSPTWWVKFKVGGQEVRRSSGTTDKRAAQEYEAKLRHESFRQIKLGDTPNHTWAEALTKWFSEAGGRRKRHDHARLTWFNQYLADTKLSDIDTNVLEKLRAIKCLESSQQNANRTMTLVRSVLRKAHSWKWLATVPPVPMYKPKKSEPRFLTQEQFADLEPHLLPHQRVMANFAVQTGLRMRNQTHLQWEQVDMKRKLLIVPASQAKGGDTIAIPLSSAAMAILQSLTPRSSGPVFTYRGKPIDNVHTKAFKKAARAAGLPWLRWHDFRHCFASWHIQNGTPMHILQELGGWKSPAMVARYAHLAPSHLAQYADNFAKP